jgi:adenosylmethionine-8-amino-7-oxononanoate aminotransferase
LRERFGNHHHHVGDIGGRGLLWGVEIVADRANKATFDADLKLHARSKQKAIERGVDGRSGDQVLLAPPFIVTKPEVETIVETLALAIDDALIEIGAA